MATAAAGTIHVVGTSTRGSSSSIEMKLNTEEGTTNSHINNISLTESFESTEASLMPDAEGPREAAPPESVATSTSAAAMVITPPRVGSSPKTKTKRLFFAKSPTSTPTRPSKTSRRPSPPRHFRLRPTFHRLGSDQEDEKQQQQQQTKNDLQKEAAICPSLDVTEMESHSIGTSTTGEASSVGGHEEPSPMADDTDDDANLSEEDSVLRRAGDDDDKEANTSNESSGSALFRDEMDIVAFQEWPLSRHRIRRQRTPAVETIATQLGRSPVRVSFRGQPELVDDLPKEEPVAMTARTPTGLPPPPQKVPSSSSELEKWDETGGGCVAGCSLLNAIETTLYHMMCID